MKKILVLGNGLLGKEVINQTNWDSLNRKKDGFDITSDLNKYEKKISTYEQVFNCIGHTDTYSNEKKPHWEINYEAVTKLVDLCNKNNIKLIHVSTDYIYSNSVSFASELDVPVHCQNWYGYTKLLADGYVQLRSKNYLLIRSTHKKNPFPYEKGWDNQVGNFDYVNIIVEIMIKLIKKNVEGIYNVGTDFKSMYQLGKRTNKNIEKVAIDNLSTTPKDVSMNCNKLKTLFEK